MWDNLRIMHAIAAAAHGVQAGYGFYLTNVTFKDRGQFQITNDSQVVGKPYRLGNLVSTFPAMSTANHLWSVLDQSGYDTVLKHGYNPQRWGEYSVSAGLMYVVIAQLCGITDVKWLSMLAASNVALQYTGYSIEKDTAVGHIESAQRQEVIGFITFVSTWIPLFVAFFTQLDRSENSVPAVVYSIVAILFALMLCFGVWSVFYQRGRIRNFRTVEKGYLILSFVSKTLLTNLTLFGALRPNDPDSLTSKAVSV